MVIGLIGSLYEVFITKDKLVYIPYSYNSLLEEWLYKDRFEFSMFELKGFSYVVHYNGQDIIISLKDVLNCNFQIKIGSSFISLTCSIYPLSGNLIKQLYIALRQVRLGKIIINKFFDEIKLRTLLREPDFTYDYFS